MNEESSEQQLQEQIKFADDIRRLRLLAEFRALDRVLKDIYRDAVEKLLLEESSEQRMRIKVIDEIFDKMEYDLQLGKDAAEYLARKRKTLPDSTL